MTQPKSTKVKGPCQFSEYQTRYKGDASKKRDPIRKPDDQLKNEGQVDYNTTHLEKFPAHQVEKRRYVSFLIIGFILRPYYRFLFSPNQSIV